MELDKDWTPFDAGEIDTVAVDISSYFRILPNDVVTGVTATCLVAKGSPVVDPTPQLRINGAAQFNMTAQTSDGVRPLLLQKVVAPTDPTLMGCRYAIRFDFTTLAGNTPSAYGHWFVLALR